MINDAKQLWFKIIYFSSSYNGGKTLVPNKLGLGTFIDIGEPELKNKSNRIALVFGVTNTFTYYLPIQSNHSKNKNTNNRNNDGENISNDKDEKQDNLNDNNSYSDNYMDGLYELLNLEFLCENSLSNNSVLHYDNIIEIDNRLLIDAIKKQIIKYKNIFVNDLKDDRCLLPLKIVWELYRVANSDFWENNVTIQILNKEFFGKKEENVYLDNEKYGYIKAGNVIATSIEQVDKTFKNISKNERTYLGTPEFHKNNIRTNLDNIKTQYMYQNKYICNLLCKTIDEKYLKHIVNKDEWLKNVNGMEMFNGILKSYEYEKNKNNGQKIYVMEKNIVDQFGNNINSTKENNTNKNINCENKKGFEK